MSFQTPLLLLSSNQKKQLRVGLCSSVGHATAYLVFDRSPQTNPSAIADITNCV